MRVQMLQDLRLPDRLICAGIEDEVTEDRASYLIAQGLAKPVRVDIVRQAAPPERQQARKFRRG